MGRSAYQYYVRDLYEAQEIIEKILKEKHFSQITMRSGELVWKKGTGALMAQQFISTYFYEDEKRVLIYAWVQSLSGLPGAREMPLESMGASIPRRQLEKVIVEIKDRLNEIRN